jgi:hypothetical protein
VPEPEDPEWSEPDEPEPEPDPDPDPLPPELPLPLPPELPRPLDPPPPLPLSAHAQTGPATTDIAQRMTVQAIFGHVLTIDLLENGPGPQWARTWLTARLTATAMIVATATSMTAVIVATTTAVVIATVVVAAMMLVARAIIGAAPTRRGRCRRRGRTVADMARSVIEPAAVALVLDEIVGALAHECWQRRLGRCHAGIWR